MSAFLPYRSLLVSASITAANLACISLSFRDESFYLAFKRLNGVKTIEIIRNIKIMNFNGCISF